METVIIARREVDDHEECVVLWLRPHAGETVSAYRSRAQADLRGHAHILSDSVGERLVARNGGIYSLPVLLGSGAGPRSPVRASRRRLDRWS